VGRIEKDRFSGAAAEGSVRTWHSRGSVRRHPLALHEIKRRFYIAIRYLRPQMNGVNPYSTSARKATPIGLGGYGAPAR